MLLGELNLEDTKKAVKTFGDYAKFYMDITAPAVLKHSTILDYRCLFVGEAMALKWGDVDFNGRFIKIQRGLSRSRIGTPKNNKFRCVDMSKQLTEALHGLMHRRKVETVKNGWGTLPEWIFISENAKFLDLNNWRKRVFNRALGKAELRQIRIHDLRHSYASILIQQGESLAYVRDHLNHSIKMTVDIYGHLAPEGNKTAVDKLDDAPSRTLYAPKNKQALNQIG